MKKSLIALAVLGSVAGAAQAQSAVTLYGIVDLWVGSAKGDATGFDTTIPGYTGLSVGGKSNTLMQSGGVSGSRWGLKGSEDLGGGLKAVFQLENGFNADTGNATNASFGRQAYLGLAGGFGTVTFGNVYSAMDDVLGASNSGFDSALSASNNVLVVPMLYNSNPKNAFKYVSPSFGGFSGGFSYSLDEDTGAKTNQTDFSLSYAAGPIAANFAYEIQGDGAGAPDDIKLTALNGSYDLGMAKLLASFGQAKAVDFKATDIQFGVDVPLSAALTLSAGYAQSKDNAAAGDGKRTGFGVAAAYGLSKRTTVYGGFRTSKMKDGAGTKIDEDRAFAVGLKHTF